MYFFLQVGLSIFIKYKIRKIYYLLLQAFWSLRSTSGLGIKGRRHATYFIGFALIYNATFIAMLHMWILQYRLQFNTLCCFNNKHNVPVKEYPWKYKWVIASPIVFQLLCGKNKKKNRCRLPRGIINHLSIAFYLFFFFFINQTFVSLFVEIQKFQAQLLRLPGCTDRVKDLTRERLKPNVLVC